MVNVTIPLQRLEVVSESFCISFGETKFKRSTDAVLKESIITGLPTFPSAVIVQIPNEPTLQTLMEKPSSNFFPLREDNCACV